MKHFNLFLSPFPFLPASYHPAIYLLNFLFFLLHSKTKQKNQNKFLKDTLLHMVSVKWLALKTCLQIIYAPKSLYLGIYMVIHILMHAKTISKKRGHDFVREWEKFWESLDGGGKRDM